MGKKIYRIRKLTPRECFRLMGVNEIQLNRMLEKESASQCYKGAGNSIVVPVLCAIFSQLGIQGKKRWNEMSDKERYELITKDCYVKNLES